MFNRAPRATQTETIARPLAASPRLPYVRVVNASGVARRRRGHFGRMSEGRSGATTAMLLCRTLLRLLS